MVVDEGLAGQHRAAQNTALAVHVLGAGIDHHIGAVVGGPLQNRRGENIVHHHARANPVGQRNNRLQIDQVQGRVGWRFEKDHRGAVLNGGPPLRQIGAIHQVDVDAVAGQQLGQDIVAGAEQGAGGNHVIAVLQLAQQGGKHRRHAGGGGEAGLRTIDLGQPLLEHGNRGIAVAGIDEALVVAEKAGLRLLGAVVDKAGVEVQRFRGLAMGRAVQPGPDGAGAGPPV